MLESISQCRVKCISICLSVIIPIHNYLVASLKLGMISREDIMKMANRRHWHCLGRRFEQPLIVDGMTITKDDTESLLNIIVRLKNRLIRMMKRYCM